MAEDRIRMVSNAMRVLEELNTSEEPETAGEISDKCGFRVASVERILATLVHEGWAFSLNGSLYIAGAKAGSALSRQCLYMALADVSATVLTDYVAKYHEAMNVSILEGSESRILQQVRAKDIINYVPPVDTRLAWYASAGGKVLASALPAIERENLYEFTPMVPYTKYTITDPDALEKELRICTEKGFALDYHELLDPACCVAVPIMDPEQTPIAAVSFSGLLNMVNRSDLEQYVPALREASAEITAEMYAAEKNEIAETNAEADPAEQESSEYME